jgi:hypothetical protein
MQEKKTHLGAHAKIILQRMPKRYKKLSRSVTLGGDGRRISKLAAVLPFQEVKWRQAYTFYQGLCELFASNQVSTLLSMHLLPYDRYTVPYLLTYSTEQSPS